eukprot:CAMPEP_0172423858 /NCGR_PEP_ID=MMETSP1064-20121228/17781_1 /TAXON_ID=202472 /ORGANISM="Aulacoseira subarctica , Strain CCAP 1002/5" /LENGTH=239 /DNA_ID=CAMNT_0013165409 /DNA_START=79 /DNA_END=798 /DNA_ORIENTATION=-
MASTRASTAPDKIASMPDASAARKGRVEKISQKTSSNGPLTEHSRVEQLPAAAVPPKKRKLPPSDQETFTVAKAPKLASQKVMKEEEIMTATTKEAPKQMRYDPEVPMTKDEASAWRREQRRLRNRESAAASRQKTRERITELEGELDEWKLKYSELERNYQLLLTQQPGLVQNRPNDPGPVTVVSPPVSPQVTPMAIPGNSPSSTSLSEYHSENQESVYIKDRNQQHLIETISRPAEV